MEGVALRQGPIGGRGGMVHPRAHAAASRGDDFLSDEALRIFNMR